MTGYLLGIATGFIVYHLLKGILWAVGNGWTTYDIAVRISDIMDKYDLDPEDEMLLDKAKVLIARYPVPIEEVEK